MIDIDFSDVQKLEAMVSELEARFSDYTGFWNDFATELLTGAVRDVFQTEGYGTWAPLDPATVRAKALAGEGARILERTGAYREAATTLSDPGNVLHATATELMYGVSGESFAARFGENYPERHEFGIGVPMRSVFGLLAEDDGFDREVSVLLEKWSREEIAETERV